MNTYLFKLKSDELVLVEMSQYDYVNKIKMFGSPSITLDTIGNGKINSEDIAFTIGRVMSANY